MIMMQDVEEENLDLKDQLTTLLESQTSKSSGTKYTLKGTLYLQSTL